MIPPDYPRGAIPALARVLLAVPNQAVRIAKAR
jgi:hypothetical protein